jgi:hypothetical protein
MTTAAAITDEPGPGNTRPRAKLAAAITRVSTLRKRVDDLERAESSAMSLRIDSRRARDDRRADLEHARGAEGGVLVTAVVNGGSPAHSPVADAETALHRAEYQYENARKASQSVGADLERSRSELSWQRQQLSESIAAVIGASPELAALRERHAAALQSLQACESIFRLLRTRGASDASLRPSTGVLEHDADPAMLQRWVAWLEALASDPEASFPEVG